MKRHTILPILTFGLALTGCSNDELAAVHQQLQEVRLASTDSSASGMVLAGSSVQAVLYHMAIGFSEVMAKDAGDDKTRPLEPLETGDTQFYYEFDPGTESGKITAFRDGKNVVYLSFLYEPSKVDMGYGFLVKAIGGQFEGYQLALPSLTFTFTGVLDGEGKALTDANGDYMFDVRAHASGTLGIGGRSIHRLESADIALRYPLGEQEANVGSLTLLQDNGRSLVTNVFLAESSLSLRGDVRNQHGQKTHQVATDSAGKVTLQRIDAPPASPIQPTP